MICSRQCNNKDLLIESHRILVLKLIHHMSLGGVSRQGQWQKGSYISNRSNDFSWIIKIVFYLG